LSKLRGRVLVVLALIGLAVPVAHAGSGVETRLGFSICPSVTTTTYPTAPTGLNTQGCGSPVMSANDHMSVCDPPRTDPDLGAFDTSQSPFGMFVSSGAVTDCSAKPPMLRPAAAGAAIDVSVAQRGFCPTSVAVSVREGINGVVFPVGTLPLGMYDATVTLPPQTATDPRGITTTWAGVQVRGVLRVGAKFTETHSHALVSRGRIASLIRNSIAGQGAADFVLSGSKLSGKEYFACGTINISAAVSVGKHGAISGRGTLVGGTGNYADVKGDFTLRGSYNAKTNRGTFKLAGEARF
jgi:hypothetical protein